MQALHVFLSSRFCDPFYHNGCKVNGCNTTQEDYPVQEKSKAFNFSNFVELQKRYNSPYGISYIKSSKKDNRRICSKETSMVVTRTNNIPL